MTTLIGIVDTMFARVDMGSIVESALKKSPDYHHRFQTVRRTVPGLKTSRSRSRF